MNIKRRIKKELKRIPIKSFDEWLSKNPEIAAYYTEKPAPKKKAFPKWAYAAASFVVVAAIALPISLSILLGGGTSPGDSTPIGQPPITNEIVEYGANDIESVPIIQEYFKDLAGVLLIDLEKISGDCRSLKEVPIDNTSIDLSYVFKDAFVPFTVENQPFALYMTYRVRIYEKYIFAEEQYYNNLDKEIAIGDYVIKYKINEALNNNECLVYFNHNGNDYFISLKEAMPQWVLTETSLQAFLSYLFN